MESITCSCVNCGKKHAQSDMQWRKIDGYKSRAYGHHCSACIEKKIKRTTLNTARANFRKSTPARPGFYY